MKRIAVLLGVLVAGPALAQTPQPPTFCPGLNTAISAAGAERPFMSLVPAGQSPGTLPGLASNPTGFNAFFPCEIYRAGNAVDGTIGGGPHNYFRCVVARTDSDDFPAGAAKIDEHAAVLAASVLECLSPQGWTATEPEITKDYEDSSKTWLYRPPAGETEVLVTMLTDAPSNGSRITTVRWSARLIVRAPNPKHPGYARRS